MAKILSSSFSSWHLILSIAAPFGVFAMIVAGINGDWGMFSSVKVYWILVILSLIGGLLSWALIYFVKTTPISAIRSAPQGYVAIQGIAQAVPGKPLLTSPGSGETCLWYYYRSPSNGTGHNRTPSKVDQSKQAFLVRDETGEVVVNPMGADINGDGTREKVIQVGNKVYVLGQFETVPVKLYAGDAVANTLANTLSAPKDGRPFVIQTQESDSILDWEKLLLRLNLIIFLVSLLMLGWLYVHQFPV